MSVQVLRPLTINTAPAPADFRYAPADFQPFAQQDLQNQPPPVDAFFGPGATAAMQYPYAQAMMEHAPQHHQRPAMTSTSSSHSGCGDEHFDAFQQGSFGGYEQAAKPAHFFASLSPSAPPHHSSKPIAIGQAPRSVSAGDVTSRRRLSPVSHPYSMSPHEFSSVPPSINNKASGSNASGRNDDEEKKARRKEQNRLAQQDLRKRRMEHAQFLEGRVAELSRQIEQQNNQIAILRSQNEQIHEAYQKLSGGRVFEFASPPLAPTIHVSNMNFGPAPHHHPYAQAAANAMNSMGATTPPDSAESRRESMVSYPGFTTGAEGPHSSSNSVHSFDLSPNTPYSQLQSQQAHQMQPSPQGPIRTPSSGGNNNSSVANHVSIGFMLGGPQGRRPSPPQLYYETTHEQQAQMAYVQ